MNIVSGIAIYFIMWWLVLFTVLPFGVRNSAEAGEAVQQGNEPGAPVHPMILRKVVITTILATVLFVIFYVAVVRGWLGFEYLPFLRDIPNPNG